MNQKRKLLLSGVTASILLSSSLNGADIIVNDDNTTRQIITNGTDNVTVTSDGNITLAHASVIQIDTTGYSGIIENNGTIENTGASGIAMSQSLLSGGTIVNNGSLIGNSLAIALTGNNEGNITNLVSGTIIGKISDAINITGDNNGTINNSGLIQGNSQGITITNNGGNIINTSSGSISSVNSSIYITNSNNGNIINDGNMTSSSSFGIYSSVGNSGVITNNGIINASTTGIMIAIGSAINSGTITNSGTINAGERGIFVRDNTNIISNTGDINSSNYGILVAKDNNGTITNSGTITVSNDSNNSFGISIGGDSNGTLTNSGTITADTAIYINGEGNITNSGTLNGDINATNATLTNSGTIVADKILVDTFIMSANSDINISKDSSIAIDNITLGENTTFTFDVHADGNETNPNIDNGAFTTSNTLSIPDSTNIFFNVTATDGNQTFMQDNNTSNLFYSDGGPITANLSDLNVTDNSALLKFTLQYATDGNNSINAKIEKALTAYQAAKNTTVKGAYGAAAVIDSLGDSSNSEISSFISQLNTLATEEEVGKAVLTTTPMSTTSTPSVANQIVSSATNVVGARVQAQSGTNSGDIAFSDKNFWFKPFGGKATQDNKNGLNGYDASFAGFGLGTDGEYEDGKRAGISFFYTNSDVDTNDVAQNTKIDTFNVIAYHNQNIIDNKTTLLVQGGFGAQKTESSRTISGVNKTAKAQYTSMSYFVKANISRDYRINDKLKMIPSINGSLVHFRNPEYSETGAGGLNLNVKSFNTNEYLVGIENKLAYAMSENTNLITRVGLKYNLDNEANTVNSSYQGASTNVFATTGIKSSEYSYEIGIGINSKIDDRLTFDLDYDYDGKTSGFSNSMISGKFNWKF